MAGYGFKYFFVICFNISNLFAKRSQICRTSRNFTESSLNRCYFSVYFFFCKSTFPCKLLSLFSVFASLALTAVLKNQEEKPGFWVSTRPISNSSRPLNRNTEDSFIQASTNKYICKFQSEEDLSTIVFVGLNSISGTFSPVFLNILIKVEANPVQISLLRLYSAATTNSKLDY